MAKKDTYQPSAELMALVRRYQAGDRSDELINALNEAIRTDADFNRYFKSIKSTLNVNVGRGRSYSVGTNGSRVSGPNDRSEVGNYTSGAGNWNRQRNMNAGSRGQPTSPGGFKSSGRDEDSALRRSGTVSADTIKSKVSINGDGSVTLGNRKYTKAQVNSIINRGMSGATMGWVDQAIYDKVIGYGANMDEVVANRAEEMLNSAVDPAEIAAREMARQEQMKADADAADIQKRQRDLDDWQFKQDYAAKLAAEAEAKKAADDLRKDGLTRAAGYIKAGTHEYTKDQLDKMGEMQNEIDRISFDNTMSDDAKDKAIQNLRSQIERIRVNPHEKVVPEKSIEDAYNETYVNERGVRMAQDKDGKWYVVDNPKDYEAENKAYEREEARKYKEQERQDKWLDSRISELTKERKSKGDVGQDIVIPGLSYRDAYNQAKDEMNVRFGGGNADVVTQEPEIGIQPTESPQTETEMQEQRHPFAPQINAPMPTSTEKGKAWSDSDSFFNVRRDEGPFSELAADESRLETGVCPVCNAPLNNFGVCDTCGWPDEGLVNEWKLMN